MSLLIICGAVRQGDIVAKNQFSEMSINTGFQGYDLYNKITVLLREEIV